MQYLPAVATELVCRTACQTEASCHVYTYYSLEDPIYHGACFLLLSLQEPVNDCDDCRNWCR